MLKKIFSIIICSFLLGSLLEQTVVGANNVSDIQVEVALFDDGSAYITQTWNCNFTEGTEGYIPIQNLDHMSITNILVSDINGPFTYLEEWDIEDSFEEKSGKYGLLETDLGYELCWGISEYGERRYAIEYKINNFVGAYEDFDGFNFQFINSGMGTLPTDVTVKLLMQNGTKLDANNAGIWAFGFEGQIDFEEGTVVAFTQSPLSSSSDSVIIMMQLNKGIINPSRIVNESFETVKAEAFKGSDYDAKEGDADTNIDASVSSSDYPEEEPGLLAIILGSMMSIITFFFPLALIIFVLFQKSKQKKKVVDFYNNADYFREVPIAGNLEATFVLSKKIDTKKDDGNLIGAAFLKLINAGCLEPNTEKTVGLFGKEKENIALKLIHPPDFTGITTSRLYDVLVLASGNDQILQENELENYCSRNHSTILKIIEDSKEDGKKTLQQIACYDTSKKSFLGLSERGKNLLLNIVGFKKYLLEFSLIGERSISESIIWHDYLTFAALLGIADKVMEQFEKIYPDVTSYSQNAHYLIARRYNKASYGAAQVARSAGKGGHSSFGGGGGFSGGGTGGGTR